MPLSQRSPSIRLLLLSLALALCSGSAPAAGAPLVDVRARLAYWDAAPSGTVASGDDRFDIDDDLGFGRNGGGMFSLSFEHPAPLLPNFRLHHVSLADSADATIQRTSRFGPVQFQRNEQVHSEYDVTMTGATFYYSPVNNWVSLDLGVDVRRLDVQVEMRNRTTGQGDRAGGTAVVPLAYVAARAQLPLTGAYVEGEINAISANGDSLQDLRAAVGWEPEGALGIEAGYRRFALDFDDVDDLSADVDFAGPYLAATLRF